MSTSYFIGVVVVLLLILAVAAWTIVDVLVRQDRKFKKRHHIPTNMSTQNFYEKLGRIAREP